MYISTNIILAIVGVLIVYYVVVATPDSEGASNISVIGQPLNANQRTLIDCSWQIANPLFADAEIFNEVCTVQRNSPTCSVQGFVGFIGALKVIGLGKIIDYTVDFDLAGSTTMKVDGTPTTELKFKIGENIRIQDWINSDWSDIEGYPQFSSKVCAYDRPSYDIELVAITADGAFIDQVKLVAT